MVLSYVNPLKNVKEHQLKMLSNGFHLLTLFLPEKNDHFFQLLFTL